MSHLTHAQRKNFIVLAVGPKGSGKSELLRTVYVPEHTRVITVDQTGEGRESYPRAIESFGYRNVLGTIRELHSADSKGRGWHVIAVLNGDEISALLTALAPRYGSGRVSLSAALGGVAVECGEIDTIFPVSGTTSLGTDVIARARHYRLSWIMATQRPHQCARILSSQSDEIVSFRMHEPRDLRWLANAAGESYAAAVRRLPRYHYARFTVAEGSMELVDADGETYTRASIFGPGLDGNPSLSL